MSMSRILEFSPSSEEAVVSRVLVLVHQTVDDYFPSALQTNRQFTKTVFSDEGENTAISHVPTPGQFSHIEDTSPGDGAGAALEASPKENAPPPSPTSVPTPPRGKEPKSDTRPMVFKAPEAKQVTRPTASAKNAAQGDLAFTEINSLHASQMTGMAEKVASGPDWTTRITIAMLIAGLAMLAYVLLAPAA